MAINRGSEALPTGAKRAFIARAVTLPIATISGLVAVRVTVSTLGVNGYALFALVVGLAALNPVGDLGVGAAVTDAVARRRELGIKAVEEVLRTSLRVLIMVSVVVISIIWFFAIFGLWAWVLGTPNSLQIEIATAASLTLFAVGLPLGLCYRVLLGAERSEIALVFQSAASVVTLLIILLCAMTNAPLWAYVAAPSASAVFAAIAAWPLASATSGISLTEVVHSVWIRANSGAKIAHLAVPMMVISAALPFAYQSDRILLSHFSNLGQVAIYSLGAQLFAAVSGLVGAAGMTLWPSFARRRGHQPVLRQEWKKLTLIFSLLGAILALLLVAIGPWVAQFVTKGKLNIGYGVFGSFGLLLVVQASWFPSAMLLTDHAGLKFQAVTHVVMMIANVGASAVLAHYIGAAGPVIGSVGASFFAVWLPGMHRALSYTERK